MAIDLVAFQEDLIARMRAAADSEVLTPKLGFEVGKEKWMVDVRTLNEVLPVPTVLPVPLTQRWFSGVANVRGALYSIVDFAGFQGGEATPAGPEARLILLKTAVRCGIVVARIVGLTNPDRLELRRERPSALVIAEYLDDQGVLWRELDANALQDHVDFMNVAA